MGQKSKLIYRHSELGAVKAKKLGMFRPSHCSLYLLYSQEKKRKKELICLLFPLHCNMVT